MGQILLFPRIVRVACGLSHRRIAGRDMSISFVLDYGRAMPVYVFVH